LTSDSLDLGWGNYNFITHIVTGDSLYVISLANGAYKKLRIDALAGGQYLFTYADLDGSNEVAGNIDKVDYTDKNFAYYSIENDMEIDREPLNTEWDITFVKYIDFVPTPYGVTGVLVNKWARSGKVDNTPVGSADWNATSFEESMNGIGFDWKNFNMTTFQWEIQDSLTYFVESRDGNIWEIVFTGFGGAATGEFFFDYQQVSATSVSDLDRSDISVYPNPSNGIVNIQIPTGSGRRFLTVYNIAGKAVRSLDLNASSDLVTVDLTEVPAGLYLVELISGTSRTVARVMVEQ
jgi:hypothetical protein